LYNQIVLRLKKHEKRDKLYYPNLRNDKNDFDFMGYDFGIPTPLLRFLGACVYGNPKEYYAGLTEAERSELDEQGRGFALSTWFYRYLHDVLPDEKRDAYQKIYQARQIKAMMDAQELKRLYHVLSAHSLRFVPIKGADLAYRLYPDAALRAFGDWDIWFHPDDCERALAILMEDGWKIPKKFSDQHDAAIKTTAHHFSVHIRGQNTLEPHYTLANFRGVDPHEMWEHTVEYPAGDGQRVLSPEMNLLMLTRHAASWSYYHTHIPKLSTDAAMVMRENVDFIRVRELADRWHLPYPGDLLAAFPEFFPEEMIRKFERDPARAAEFRAIFDMRGKLGGPDNETLLLSRFEARGEVTRGIRNHIQTLTPEKIRRFYHLPKRGAYGRVFWAYLCYFWTRGSRGISWMRNKQKNRDYTRAVESIESGTKSSVQQ
jgi:hypothetical protein